MRKGTKDKGSVSFVLGYHQEGRFVRAVSTLLLMTLLSGCGKGEPMQPGGLVQDSDAGGTAAGGASVTGDVSAGPGAEGETGNGAEGEKGYDKEGGSAGVNGAAGTASGKQPLTNSQPEVYSVDEIYTEAESILPITGSASAWGISYKIENVEYTESFGNRNLDRLDIVTSGAAADSQGTLSGGYKYLFLTITFTNVSDQAQDVVRTGNGIAVIGSSLNTIPWATDTCYYDVDWEKGTESQKHHWMLEPGESVTSEVGWVIAGWEREAEADDTLAERMGSSGPYELYYHVKQYDGDNEGSYFIGLGVEAE